jgi:hypothetical protein
MNGIPKGTRFAAGLLASQALAVSFSSFATILRDYARQTITCGTIGQTC